MRYEIQADFVKRSVQWRIANLLGSADGTDALIRGWMRGTDAQVGKSAFLVLLDGGFAVLQGVTATGALSSVPSNQDHLWGWDEVRNLGIWGPKKRLSKLALHPRIDVHKGPRSMAFHGPEGRVLLFSLDYDRDVATDDVMRFSGWASDQLHQVDATSHLASAVSRQAQTLLPEIDVESAKKLPIMLELDHVNLAMGFLAIGDGAIGFFPMETIRNQDIPQTERLLEIHRFSLDLPPSYANPMDFGPIATSTHLTNVRLVLHFGVAVWKLWLPFEDPTTRFDVVSTVDELIGTLSKVSDLRVKKGYHGLFLQA